MEERKLAYFAKKLGIVEVLEGAIRLRGGLIDGIEDSAAYPTTAARDLLSASSSSAMLIDAATVSSTPSSTGEWFCFCALFFFL